jgi:hypothetical protein
MNAVSGVVCALASREHRGSILATTSTFHLVRVWLLKPESGDFRQAATPTTVMRRLELRTFRTGWTAAATGYAPPALRSQPVDYFGTTGRFDP